MMDTEKIEAEVMAADHLEGVIDRHGLEWAVRSLARICWEKAEHIESFWIHSAVRSRKWSKASTALDLAADKIEQLDIP